MAKIDVSGWKEFKLDELFDVSTSKSVDKTSLQFTEVGLYDYISRTNTHNGVMGCLTEIDGLIPNKAGTFSVVQIGANACFYRERDWYAAQNIFVLTPKHVEINNVGLYLSSVITKSMEHTFGDNAYANYPTLSTLKDMSIQLPVITGSNGQSEPDWSGMKAYQQTCMLESKASLRNLRPYCWRELSLFSLGFSNYHGQRLNKSQRVDGLLPFITAGKENRGLTMHIGNKRDSYVCPITVDMFGNCFYHPYECSGDDNVYFFVNNELSANTKIFISVVIGATISEKFAYSDQFRQSDADSLVVCLPVNTQGEPDWDYMDAYMQQVMEQSETTLKQLRHVTA